ncbi:MAG TPA: type II toxin-antitoxin system PemK/MazF family toxin [Caldilineaceae bacterium]|nr:type II toxin-antitoxin system PemK/MazF family toxin [Caldilineaceae bacterium]
MVIEQGDVFWIEFVRLHGADPGYRRPYVVVQGNTFNYSRIDTVVLCAITSSLARAEAPGNVRLEPGEANLPRASVVNVSQLLTVDKRDLVDKIGTLPWHRVQQIVEGIHLLLDPSGF